MIREDAPANGDQARRYWEDYGSKNLNKPVGGKDGRKAKGDPEADSRGGPRVVFMVWEWF